jgi:hypothetical protein
VVFKGVSWSIHLREERPVGKMTGERMKIRSEFSNQFEAAFYWMDYLVAFKDKSNGNELSTSVSCSGPFDAGFYWPNISF